MLNRNWMKVKFLDQKLFKIIVLIILIIFISLFFALDFYQYTNLSFIKDKQLIMEEFYERKPVLVLMIFALSYFLVTALSLPAAVVLTLLGGALFGFSIALVIISFVSTLGATVAFLIARFLAREYVQLYFKKQLLSINNGFEHEGAFYLFALRLVPIFPFFIINIVMSLLPIKTWTFYWVSQIGMLPGTAVFVYAGTQLAQINEISDITSPSLLLAFTMLGLFPLVTKKVLKYIRKDKGDE